MSRILPHEHSIGLEAESGKPIPKALRLRGAKATSDS